MNKKATSQPQNASNADKELNKTKAANQTEDMVNPSHDLTYQGGYTKDPSEIISNPAVAPQTIDDRRDLRSDITHNDSEAEDA